MKQTRIIVLAVGVAVLLTIVLQNTADATFRLFVVKITMPLALMLAVMLGAGFALGLVSALWFFRKTDAKP